MFVDAFVNMFVGCPGRATSPLSRRARRHVSSSAVQRLPPPAAAAALVLARTCGWCARAPLHPAATFNTHLPISRPPALPASRSPSQRRRRPQIGQAQRLNSVRRPPPRDAACGRVWQRTPSTLTHSWPPRARPAPRTPSPPARSRPTRSPARPDLRIGRTSGQGFCPGLKARADGVAPHARSREAAFTYHPSQERGRRAAGRASLRTGVPPIAPASPTAGREPLRSAPAPAPAPLRTRSSSNAPLGRGAACLLTDSPPTRHSLSPTPDVIGFWNASAPSVAPAARSIRQRRRRPEYKHVHEHPPHVAPDDPLTLVPHAVRFFRALARVPSSPSRIPAANENSKSNSAALRPVSPPIRRHHPREACGAEPTNLGRARRTPA
ncbi:hypothetical protein K488DRAFT_87792 [Vararia minispora EC-137]|uniref:Uncharacterized protein n=1 Tax=Vararia minispora EC-137 TaxID=1314806 RepID=A0ACB8QFI1_9AGAM|nr:hypothetical protein K488DRAFT_87792 [Vararia minispora EC-137]